MKYKANTLFTDLIREAQISYIVNYIPKNLDKLGHMDGPVVYILDSEILTSFFSSTFK